MPPVRLPQRRSVPDQPFTVCTLVVHTTGAETHRGKFLGAHISQPIVFDYFHCGGSENSLLECGRGIGRVCQHSADVSVVCSESILKMWGYLLHYVYITRVFRSQYIPVHE